MDLFSHASAQTPDPARPLAERMRPSDLQDFLGQEKYLGARGMLRDAFEKDQLPSLIIWGPPGTGKTTFANILAKKSKSHFVSVHAVETGSKALKEICDQARHRKISMGEKTVLFLDEIHRLNKGQQDVLLPFVEKGDIFLIGATTENPGFEINSALLSRCRLVVFDRLSPGALSRLFERAASLAALKSEDVLTKEGLADLVRRADGDGRRLLNMAEQLLERFRVARARPASSQIPQSGSKGSSTLSESLIEGSQNDGSINECSPDLAPQSRAMELSHPSSTPTSFDPNSAAHSSIDNSGDQSPSDNSIDHFVTQPANSSNDSALSEAVGPGELKWPLSAIALSEVLDQSSLVHDRAGDSHFDLLSALIKSLRGSDPNASLYYLARLIESGEAPELISRRLIIFASEDIGNADPRGLLMATAAAQAVERVGLPEAGINLSHLVTYLATAPKSNRSYLAWKKALEEVRTTRSLPVPPHIRNAPTSVARSLGYGQGYRYPHDFSKGWVDQTYLPQSIVDHTYYEPSEIGFEKTIRQMQTWMRKPGPTED